jgi:iron complex outermembrane recepter protein
MKSNVYFLLLFISWNGFSQSVRPSADTSGNRYQQYDTVVITALEGQSYNKIPYNIQWVKIPALQKTPRTQLMQHLSLLPSVSSISAGAGINKPVIRGLSFNHIQLFAQGTRIDNQTWDDRHDLGISDNGFTKVEVINGPAALLYGPNAMGGALVFHEAPPAINEKRNGFVQLGFFGNSLGGNLNAGIRAGTEKFYYSVNLTGQMHTNYVQGGEASDPGGGGGEEDKPLAFNSKFTNVAFKGMIGFRKAKSTHQFTYNLYQQSLGIIEDESLENPTNPDKEEERDYEMEAPYQNVMTHIFSTENTFATGKTELVVNAAYQFNARKEYEPGPVLKSKFLGVGLNLQTVTADVQWHSGKNRAAGVTVGVQGFYQDNKNNGNFVLVPDAHISTVGAYLLGHWNLPAWNFLAGFRVDQHQLNMFNTTAAIPDTLNPPITHPQQQLTKKYTPGSFSFGIVYHASETFSIKLNAANAFSAPNYAQLTAFGHHEGTFRFEVGDNTLKMERNLEADLTLDWVGKNVEVSLNGYFNHIRNYIYITPTADSAGPLRIYRWSQHDANIRGIELNFRVHPEEAAWFEGFINAGLLRGTLTNNSGDLPYIPANKVITGITLKKESGQKWQHLYATLQVNAFGEQNKTAQFESATNGYALTDIFLGATPPLGKKHRWDLVVSCTNLFNVGYFNHLSLIKSINVKEPGRNIGVQMRYSF